MRLLPKQESESRVKKQNDELVEKNSRLLGYFTKGVKRLNGLKDNYDQEKLNKYKEFENFSAEIVKKKSEMLLELKQIQAQIDAKKDFIYSLTSKQDELDEREFVISRKEKNLNLREDFTKQSEEVLQAKWENVLK